MATRSPTGEKTSRDQPETAGHSRPRHRLLLEEALQSQSAHRSLIGPQASVIRWKVPTGALVILALVLSGFALWPVLTGGSATTPETLVPVSSSSQEETPASSRRESLHSSGVDEPTSGSAPQTENTVIVHVTGAVISPGLYELKQGDRINDALTAAGGPAPHANTSVINLAEPLADGSQIYVPAVGEEAIIPPVQATQGKGKTPAGSSSADGHLVNLNIADATELQALPQVGPVLAETIIAWREEHGGFQSVDELDQVPGIGPAKLEKLRPLVTVQ